MRKLVVFGSCLVPALMMSDVALADHGGDIDAFCTTGAVDLTIELGDGVPLPKQYSNDSDSEVTFTLTMNDNLFFGPSHVVGETTLDAHTGLTMSEAPVVPTTSVTPLGLDQVVVEVTSSDTGATVLATCDYNLTIAPPAALLDLIQIPVRWCAVEGSPQAEGKSPGETVDGYKLLTVLAQLADEITIPGAHITFRPASAPDGIPVIADPVTTTGEVGDLVTSIFGSGEPGTAMARCEQAWSSLYPAERGTILVNAKRVLAKGLIGGVAPAPSLDLWAASSKTGTGKRGDDLCGHPRNLTVADVTPMLKLAAYDQALFGGPTYSGTALEPARVVAHELAHTLMVGHGNGLDDNGDGDALPDPGSRRYDDYCDPLDDADGNGVPDEDVPNTACEETGSLMVDACKNLRPLQAETARAVAKLVPGATFDASFDPAGWIVESRDCAPCDLPADIFLLKLEMAETPGAASTSFSHTVLGPIDATVEDQFVVFADLDDAESTGCDPSSIGFSPGFQGAELVTRVSLSTVGGALKVTPTVWRCETNALVEIDDPSIGAAAYTQPIATHGAEDSTLFGIVTIQMSNVVRGPAANEVRLQGMSEEIDGPRDLLPTTGIGGAISLLPPEPAECAPTHLIAAPGEANGVQAHGLLPNHAVDVLLSGRFVATGSTNATGDADIGFNVPATTDGGVRSLTVIVHDAAQGASCALLVQGARVTPATTATQSPEPSGAGWNGTDVTVSLAAIDVAGGPGIGGITIAATGAQSIPSHTVAASSTSPVVSTEGETTITFFATSESGLQEAPGSITVALDKTDPAIAGTRSPGPNVFGWNNTDVVVDFACTDALSGVISCTPATVFSAEGVDQSATGTALDYAFNDVSSIVGGVDIDKTDPSVIHEGNAGSYGILEQVDITCTATDALSGVLSTTCADIQGPAYTFQPGVNTFSANAIDKADNLGEASTSFSVVVTYDDLCTLTKQFITMTTGKPGKLGTSLCAELESAEAAAANGMERTRQNAIAAYLKQVAAQTNKSFTEAQAQVLYTFASAL